jgi:Wax ester synthase/diacylglycerol acyltransferase catalytic domain
VHHAIADGVAGVAAFGAFLDLSADAPAPSPPPWAPAPFPSTRELFDDNLRRRIHGFQGFFSTLTHPASTVRAVRRAWPAVRETFAEGRAPRTSLNRPIGEARTLAVVRSRLDVVKGVTFVQIKRLTAAPPALPREPVTAAEPAPGPMMAARSPGDAPTGGTDRLASLPDAGPLLDEAFGGEPG